MAVEGYVPTDLPGSDIDEDTDTGTEDSLSLPPLGKILQNTGGLITDHNDAETSRRGLLRQGVLDIQRLKDVGGNQPVSIIPIVSPSDCTS